MLDYPRVLHSILYRGSDDSLSKEQFNSSLTGTPEFELKDSDSELLLCKVLPNELPPLWDALWEETLVHKYSSFTFRPDLVPEPIPSEYIRKISLFVRSIEPSVVCLQMSAYYYCSPSQIADWMSHKSDRCLKESLSQLYQYGSRLIQYYRITIFLNLRTRY
ncbi:hypothetical protein ABKN59_005135 [Abortiporus biennis]